MTRTLHASAPWLICAASKIAPTRCCTSYGWGGAAGAIARALAVDPPLLLLVELIASLDAARRNELRELLQGLMGEGRTLMIATHDEEFASTCATRVLRMNNGIVSSQD